MNSKWTQVTIPANAPSDPEGFDFVLTPQDRDRVANTKLAIIAHKLQQNRQDDARALGVALEVFE